MKLIFLAVFRKIILSNYKTILKKKKSKVIVRFLVNKIKFNQISNKINNNLLILNKKIYNCQYFRNKYQKIK